MINQVSGSVGALATSEAILLSAYRNPKAFYASLNAERQKTMIEWIVTGDKALFKQLFSEFVPEQLGKGLYITSSESNHKSDLIAA